MGSLLSYKRPQGFGRVTVKKSGLKSSRWKAECVERRPLRLEGGKDCKVLPILTFNGTQKVGMRLTRGEGHVV
jgi:hypothetical protein